MKAFGPGGRRRPFGGPTQYRSSSFPFIGSLRLIVTDGHDTISPDLATIRHCLTGVPARRSVQGPIGDFTWSDSENKRTVDSTGLSDPTLFEQLTIKIIPHRRHPVPVADGMQTNRRSI